MKHLEAYSARVDYHVKVVLPDWLDTNPTVEEMEQVLTEHLWVLSAAQESIRLIEEKMGR